MTESKAFKRRVRERMAKTGERYTAARSQVADKRDRLATTDEPATPRSNDTPSESAVIEATGKGWDAWMAILDGWGATTKRHGEIAAYLAEEHGVPMWWTQSITVTYERARGMRAKYQRADGVFTGSVSRTLAVPVAEVYDAIVDDDRRSGWLTDGKMMFRSGTPKRTAHFDWDGGPTRVHVTFDAKGPQKTTVAVEHERLTDTDEAQAAKVAWRARLDALRSSLG